MAVTGDDAARVEDLPDVLLDLVVGRSDRGASEGGLKVEDESEDLLVGETVERTGETGETGTCCIVVSNQ